MPEVTVDVAGRSYRLGCGADEEEHLTGLAAMLDTEARGLLRQFGQMSEGRLLLMTALMVADRLAEADDKTYQTEQRLIHVGEVLAAPLALSERCQWREVLSSDLLHSQNSRRLAIDALLI